jgi:hypothetical protein
MNTPARRITIPPTKYLCERRIRSSIWNSFHPGFALARSEPSRLRATATDSNPAISSCDGG